MRSPSTVSKPLSPAATPSSDPRAQRVVAYNRRPAGEKEYGDTAKKLFHSESSLDPENVPAQQRNRWRLEIAPAASGAWRLTLALTSVYAGFEQSDLESEQLVRREATAEGLEDLKHHLLDHNQYELQNEVGHIEDLKVIYSALYNRRPRGCLAPDRGWLRSKILEKKADLFKLDVDSLPNRTKGTKPRGICSGCKESHSLNIDGCVHKHRTNGTACTGAGQQPLCIDPLLQLTNEPDFRLITFNVGGTRAGITAGQELPKISDEHARADFAQKARCSPEAWSKPNVKGKPEKVDALPPRVVEKLQEGDILCLQEAGSEEFVEKLKAKLGSDWDFHHKKEESGGLLVTLYRIESRLSEFDYGIQKVELQDVISEMLQQNGNLASRRFHTSWYDNSGNGKHPILKAFGDRTLAVDFGNVLCVNLHMYTRKVNSEVFRLADDPHTLFCEMCNLLHHLADTKKWRIILCGDVNISLHQMQNLVNTGDVKTVAVQHLHGQVEQLGKDLTPHALDWALKFGRVRVTVAGTEHRSGETQLQSLFRIIDQAKSTACKLLHENSTSTEEKDRLKRIIEIPAKAFVAHNMSDHPPVAFEVDIW